MSRRRKNWATFLRVELAINLKRWKKIEHNVMFLFPIFPFFVQIKILRNMYNIMFLYKIFFFLAAYFIFNIIWISFYYFLCFIYVICFYRFSDIFSVKDGWDELLSCQKTTQNLFKQIILIYYFVFVKDTMKEINWRNRVWLLIFRFARNFYFFF